MYIDSRNGQEPMEPKAVASDSVILGVSPMRTPLRCLSLVVLLAVAVQACRASAPDTYTFGVVAPFTGQEGAPVYGRNIRNAVDMRVEEINASGGVKGRRFVPQYEDDQLQAPVAVSAVQKLISVNGVNVIIGPVASSSTIAASKVAESNKVILISPSSTSNELSGISPYVFRTIAPDNFEAESMARLAWDKGFRRIGVAFVDNAGTRGPAEVFRRAITGKGGAVSAYEVVPQGSTDTRIQMTKLTASKPDAVYLLGYALELGSMIKQFREQNASTQILSFQVMEEPKVREIAGQAAEGIVFTTPTIYGDFASGQTKQFIDAYRKKYGEAPGIFAANAYDAVSVLAKVIDARGFETEQIRTGLLMVRAFDGASGTFDINERGDSNQQPRLMTVRNGELQLFK